MRSNITGIGFPIAVIFFFLFTCLSMWIKYLLWFLYIALANGIDDVTRRVAMKLHRLSGIRARVFITHSVFKKPNKIHRNIKCDRGRKGSRRQWCLTEGRHWWTNQFVQFDLHLSPSMIVKKKTRMNYKVNDTPPCILCVLLKFLILSGFACCEWMDIFFLSSVSDEMRVLVHSSRQGQYTLTHSDEQWIFIVHDDDEQWLYHSMQLALLDNTMRPNRTDEHWTSFSECWPALWLCNEVCKLSYVSVYHTSTLRLEMYVVTGWSTRFKFTLEC